MALADLPVRTLLNEELVEDEVTELIFAEQDAPAFAPVSRLTVGELRDWLLTDEAWAPRPGAPTPRATASRISGPRV